MLRKNGCLNIWTVTVLFAALFVCQVDGQDVVVLKTEDGQTTKRNGQIVDWKGNQLSLKTKTRTRTIDASRIIEIQTNWPEELISARELVKAGKLQEGLAKIELARVGERRPWAQQIIVAEKLQCLDAVDKTEEALIEFLKLYQHDSQTRFFHLIPLPWLLNAPYPVEGRFGASQLKSKNSLVALISASLLISSAQREGAIERLGQLASDSETRIAQLATTQLWRNELLTADANTVGRWKRQVQRLPQELRAGPLVLLAQAQSRIGDDDVATTNFMKLPILYPEKKSLCALALYRCGEILEDRGEAKLASSIQQELFRDYAVSQFAERARQK